MLVRSSVDKNIAAPDNNSKILAKNKRVAVIFLSCLGLAVIVFWAWQFQARVAGPFKGADKEAKYAAIASSTNLVKDTDGDGLSDYEEINIYKTSPYLADSDSDGISDGQEIKQGSDPNCPTGQTCGLESIVPPSQTATSSLLATSSTSTTPTTLEEKLVNGTISPAELRQLLLDNGADKATLDSMNDDELIKGYQETVQEQLNASSTATSTLAQ